MIRMDAGKDQLGQSGHTAKDQEIRVLIADGHTLMREALHRIVTTFPSVAVSACLDNVQNACAIARKTKTSVIVLGSCTSVSDCLNFVKLMAGKEAIGIVIIQHHLSPQTTMTLIKQGVHGLLGEDATEEDLVRAIQAAARGNTFLDRHTREILNSSMSQVSVHLTNREVEVLALLKKGESNFRIAYDLGMRQKTVEKHITHIYEKLGVRCRATAILQAQRLYI